MININKIARLNLLLLLLIFLILSCSENKPGLREIHSPDKNISTVFDLKNDTPVYSVWYGNNKVIDNARLGLKLANSFENGFEIISSSAGQKKEWWKPVYGEQNKILDNYNSLLLHLKEKGKAGRKLNIEFRTYDIGVAFRYIIPEQTDTSAWQINGELSEFNFIKQTKAYPIYETEQTYSNEPVPISEVKSGAYLPLTVKIPNGFASVFEAFVVDYPTSRLIKNDRSVLMTKLLGDAVIKPPFSTPWRAVSLAGNEGRLIENEYLVLNLNPSCAIENPSWIKPGKMVSNEGNVPLQTDELKKLVDLVASLDFKYLQLDWAWYGTEVQWKEEEIKYFNTIMPRLPLGWGWHGSERKWSVEQENGFNKVLPSNFTLIGWEKNAKGDPFVVAKGYVPYGPNERFKNYYTYVDLDMPELIRYAKEKGIGIWLYVEGGITLRSHNMDSLFAKYQQWGIAGIKPGFVKYGRQENTNWLRNMVKTAAKYNLLVDIHDGRIPDGLTRTYPNLMINEGGGGEEGYHPVVHDLMLPFARCLAGPFDYTPGMYTRGRSYAHMLAFMVVYHCPAQTIRRIYAPWDPGGRLIKGGAELEFLKRVPATWDETKILNAEIGKFITTARRNGNSWFVGGMTADEAREVILKLDFLEGGKKYNARIFTDDPERGSQGWCPVKSQIKQVNASGRLNLKLVEAGGFVIIFDPVK